MFASRARPRYVLATLFFPLLLLGCSDDESFEITGVFEKPPNRPPVVLSQGPEWTDETIEVLLPFPYNIVPVPWVLAGDPDGAEDIVGVLLSVDSARVSDAVVRPDSTGTRACAAASRSMTLDVASIIERTYPAMNNIPIERTAGTLFEAYDQYDNEALLYDGAAFPEIESASPSFGPIIKGCTDGGFLRRFSARPPLVKESVDVFLTSVTVEYFGIMMTVYDAAGANASTRFPNLRVRWTPREPAEP